MNIIKIGKKFADLGNCDIQELGREFEAKCINHGCKYWDPTFELKCGAKSSNNHYIESCAIYIPDLTLIMSKIIGDLVKELETSKNSKVL